MSPAGPTPLQSFLGGVGLALPVHALLVLNGSVFGISGFLHRAVRGGKEGAAAVLGLVLGGFVVGKIEGVGPNIFSTSLVPIVASGLLVGLGTKLQNGCTSGHMIAGVSRFSPRSIAATATFCVSAAITTRILHSTLPPISAPDTSLGLHGGAFLAGSFLALLATIVVPYIVPAPSSDAQFPTRRIVIFFFSAVSFALALRLSNLVDPLRVLAFLLLPPHPAFDPSLAFLAVGAIPLATLLYRSGRTRLAPTGKIDARLLAGAVIFGVGWGVEGICPGPGLLNFGRALATGSGIAPLAAWIASVVVGGLLAPS